MRTQLDGCSTGRAQLRARTLPTLARRKQNASKSRAHENCSLFEPSGQKPLDPKTSKNPQTERSESWWQSVISCSALSESLLCGSSSAHRMLVRVSKPVPPRRNRYKYNPEELQRLEQSHSFHLCVWEEQRALYRDAARSRRMQMDRKRMALKRQAALPMHWAVVVPRECSQALPPALQQLPPQVAYTVWLTEHPDEAARATARVAARVAARAAARAAAAVVLPGLHATSQSSLPPPPLTVNLAAAFDRMCLSGAPDPTSPPWPQPPPPPRPHPPLYTAL